MTGILGIDLGTASTVLHQSGSLRTADEPTLLALGRGADVLATGRASLEGRIRKRARLVHPVRRGCVVDPAGCRELLADMLRAHPSFRRSAGAMLAVPTAASPYDVSVLSGVAYSAIGVPVGTMPSLLAAARGAGVRPERPVVVCDVGAGLLEAGVVLADRLPGAVSIPIGTRELERSRLHALGSWAGALEQALATAPRGLRGELHDQPVLLVGGGAAVDGLRDELSAMWRREVVVADDPRHAVVRGLAASAGALVRAA